MHRTIRVPHALIGGLLVLGLLSGSGGAANAQKAGEVAPPPRVDPGKAADAERNLTVTVGTTTRLQMKGKQVIETVINERENVARITPIEGDATMIQITGLQPGTTQLTLTSRGDPPREKAVTEIIRVIVEIDTGLLRNLLQRTVPTATVVPIPAGTSIILSGTVEKAEDIDTILGIARNTLGPGAAPAINAMRVGGVQMVQLDVVVARVSRSELRRFALGDFGDNGTNHFLSQGTAGQFGVQTATLTGGFPSSSTATLTGSAGSPNGANSNIILSLFNSKQQLFLFLQALRDNNLAKLLAEPHLLTLSGRTAHFNSGGQQAVPQVSGFGGTAGVSFFEFGTTLDFLPIVMGNGRIYLDVTPTITALDPGAGVVIPGGGLVPGRIQQTVHTSIILEDGQTLCLAGLIETTVAASTTKIPVLGDLPFVGAFFSSKQYSEVEQEMVVIVTPHLVDAMACNQVPKLLPGQETRTPDDFELFLEGILEAPRGRREVNHGRRYVPAWQNGPTAQCYPCTAGGPTQGQPCAAVPTPAGTCGMGGGPGGAGCGCGAGGCGAGGCANPGMMPQTGSMPVPVSGPMAGVGEIGIIQPVGGPQPELATPGGRLQGEMPGMIASPEVLK